MPPATSILTIFTLWILNISLTFQDWSIHQDFIVPWKLQVRFYCSMETADIIQITTFYWAGIAALWELPWVLMRSGWSTWGISVHCISSSSLPKSYHHQNFVHPKLRWWSTSTSTGWSKFIYFMGLTIEGWDSRIGRPWLSQYSSSSRMSFFEEAGNESFEPFVQIRSLQGSLLFAAVWLLHTHVIA